MVMTITVEPLGRSFFARVGGVSFRKPPSGETYETILDAITKFSVLVFPDAAPSEEEHLAFGRAFGELQLTSSSVSGKRKRRIRAEFADVSNLDVDGNLLASDSRLAHNKQANQLWHSDASFRPTPSKFSFLAGIRLPLSGGETEFVDLRAVWDALSPEIKDNCRGKIVVHSLLASRRRVGFDDFNEEERAAFSYAPHPLARVHPGSGRTSLFVGAHADFIEGQNAEESQEFLDDLLDFATQKQFRYQHKWTAGEVVMWDNRCVIHRGRPWDMNVVREMRRVTVNGDGPTVVNGAIIPSV
jgi:alpha-ketoglutarate-dependent 2,4-dichlorophenoxyacetate dioxygenase